jgi:hypothetical protein
METVYKKREGNIKLRIYPDYDCSSPREHDNLGAFWSDGMHRRYNFHEAVASDVFERIKAAELAFMGDGGEGTEDWEDIDWMRHLQAIYPGRQHAFAIMPVYMYEHGGVSFSTAGFTCQWDSGTIGWMLCDLERYPQFMGHELALEKDAELVEQDGGYGWRCRFEGAESPSGFDTPSEAYWSLHNYREENGWEEDGDETEH